MRSPRMVLPATRRSVVAGVAVVTMVASVGATVTGAVRPARSRGGRFFRPTSGVTWTPVRSQAGGSAETSMADAIEIIRSDAHGGFSAVQVCTVAERP